MKILERYWGMLQRGEAVHLADGTQVSAHLVRSYLFFPIFLFMLFHCLLCDRSISEGCVCYSGCFYQIKHVDYPLLGLTCMTIPSVCHTFTSYIHSSTKHKLQTTPYTSSGHQTLKFSCLVSNIHSHAAKKVFIS